MKQIIWVLMVFMSVSNAPAQDVYTSSGKPGYHKKTMKKKGYDPSRLVLGGGINALFGNGYASVGISPMVGYKFTNNLVAGVGLGYQYNQQPDLNFSNPYYSSTVYYDKENIVYPNLWAKYTVWRILYIGTQLEYDLIHLNEPALDINGYQITANVNVNATCWLVGAGIKQPLGGRVYFYVELMYDVLQQDYSPYLNTIVPRGGIAVGL